MHWLKSIAVCIKLNSHSAYFDPNYTACQKLTDHIIHTALFHDFPVELLHGHVLKRDGREVPQQNLDYQWHQEKEKRTRHTL